MKIKLVNSGAEGNVCAKYFIKTVKCETLKSQSAEWHRLQVLGIHDIM